MFIFVFSYSFILYMIICIFLYDLTKLSIYVSIFVFDCVFFYVSLNLCIYSWRQLTHDKNTIPCMKLWYTTFHPPLHVVRELRETDKKYEGRGDDYGTCKREEMTEERKVHRSCFLVFLWTSECFNALVKGWAGTGKVNRKDKGVQHH